MVACKEASDEDAALTSELSRITPSNGAVAVDLYSDMTMDITQGMDITTCESRFGIYMGEQDQIPTNMMGQLHGMIPGEYH